MYNFRAKDKFVKRKLDYINYRKPPKTSRDQPDKHVISHVKYKNQHVATKGYEIRARKKSAREIVTRVKKRLRSIEPDYYLKPNPKFKYPIKYASSANHPNHKKDIVWTVSRVDYVKNPNASKSIKPNSTSMKSIEYEYGLKTVKANRNMSYEPSPISRHNRFSPYTLPKHDDTMELEKNNSCERFLTLSHKKNSADKFVSVKTTDSQKIKPVELKHDEEAVIYKQLTSFDSPQKHHKTIY